MRRNLLRYLLAGLVLPIAASAVDVPALTAPRCESFGFKFYRRLSATQTYRFGGDTNVAISPLSLASVLQALRLGASGKTEEELTQALQGEGVSAGSSPVIAQPLALKNKAVQFFVANSLWVDKGFVLKPRFVKATKDQLDAAVFPADFSQPAKEADQINHWISKQTAGHISDLVQPNNLNGALMVVANAVYFKADWREPFDAAKTKQEPFHLASGKTVNIPTMNKVEQYGYAEKDGIKVLKLPYAGAEVSMLLILPKPGPKGWAALEERLTEDWFREMVGTFENRLVTVKVPRWTISCEPPDCISVLKLLGMKQMFQRNADFTGISDRAGYISVFVHRTAMEVNEKGTEAAASTVAVMLPPVFLNNPKRPHSSRIDHSCS